MGILNRLARPLALVAALVALSAVPALAQDLSPINSFFTTLGTALTGTTGRAIGLIALVAVGFARFAGRLPLVFGGSVLLGLVIVFGAATILSGF